MSNADWMFLTYGIQRFAIVVGAIYIAYLGYRLYEDGIVNGRTKFKTGGRMFPEFVLSGMGPGLAFMALGAFILVVALIKGPWRFTTIESIPPAQARRATGSGPAAQPPVAPAETPPALAPPPPGVRVESIELPSVPG